MVILNFLFTSVQSQGNLCNARCRRHRSRSAGWYRAIGATISRDSEGEHRRGFIKFTINQRWKLVLKERKVALGQKLTCRSPLRIRRSSRSSSRASKDPRPSMSSSPDGLTADEPGTDSGAPSPKPATASIVSCPRLSTLVAFWKMCRLFWVWNLHWFRWITCTGWVPKIHG